MSDSGVYYFHCKTIYSDEYNGKYKKETTVSNEIVHSTLVGIGIEVSHERGDVLCGVNIRSGRSVLVHHVGASVEEEIFSARCVLILLKTPGY